MEASLKASLDTSLKNLRLPTILSEYGELAMMALEEKYSYEQYLLSLSKREVEQRFNNKVKHLLKSAKFPKLKTIVEYDFTQVDISKEAIHQLCHGNFLGDYNNVIFFGTPGSGKTHLAMGIGRELCLKGYKVLFHTGCSLMQELVKAKNNLTLTNFFKKLMAYDLIIIDELGYIPFEKTEGDLLFQFISDRYERKSILITTNLAFSEWDSLFKDKMVATAAIDRLVHYSQIFKFDKDQSYRAEAAKKRLKKQK
ncbi:MAG: IS21-like element helper ATPase IstB [Bacteriovoracaceae bacterium]|nr:IS21-like element helper ATPase IstB [Bacteriovoracaceae bacterium]